MNNLDKAKKCYKELMSINVHILGEQPTYEERKCALNAIRSEWEEFCDESVVEEYNVNKQERSLTTKLEELERILNLHPNYYEVYE